MKLMNFFKDMFDLPLDPRKQTNQPKNEPTQEGKRPILQKLRYWWNKIENHTNRCKDILYSYIGRISIVQMTILPKAT